MKQLLKYLPILALTLFSCTPVKNKSELHPKDQIQKTQAESRETPIPTESEVPVLHRSSYRILPQNESSSDQSLKQFVSHLKEIVSKKDLKAFTACLDTGIIVSYGGGMAGIPDFYEDWDLTTNPGKSSLWSTMRRFLKLGGAWENKDEFRIPYTQCDRLFNAIPDDLDWYQTAVCISPETVVYKHPELQSVKTSLLSYEIVRIIDNKRDDFIRIQTLDKEISGFVEREQVVLSAESFPVLQKVNGNWKITCFAPYD